MFPSDPCRSWGRPLLPLHKHTFQWRSSRFGDVINGNTITPFYVGSGRHVATVGTDGYVHGRLLVLCFDADGGQLLIESIIGEMTRGVTRDWHWLFCSGFLRYCHWGGLERLLRFAEIQLDRLVLTKRWFWHKKFEVRWLRAVLKSCWFIKGYLESPYAIGRPL